MTLRIKALVRVTVKSFRESGEPLNSISNIVAGGLDPRNNPLDRRSAWWWRILACGTMLRPEGSPRASITLPVCLGRRGQLIRIRVRRAMAGLPARRSG
jgi:hypothetical protein